MVKSKLIITSIMILPLILMSQKSREEKLVQFKIRSEFLIQIDKYWPKTGKFSSRSQFIKYLLLEELNNERLLKKEKLEDFETLLKALELSADKAIEERETLIQRIENIEKNQDELRKYLDGLGLELLKKLGEKSD